MTLSYLLTEFGAITDVHYLPIRSAIETYALVLDSVKIPLAAE